MGFPFAAASMGLSALGSIFGGKADKKRAQALERQERINARIAGIRALQTETAARAGLASEMASMQAQMAAGGSSDNVAAIDMMNEGRSIRNREIRIEVANARQAQQDRLAQANDYRMQGKNALIGGFIKAAPSIFDAYNAMR